MSWNFKVSGLDKDKLKERVQQEQHCPQSIRNAICDLIDSRDTSSSNVPVGKKLGVHVESDGHVDSAYGYGKFCVNRVEMTD